MTQRRDNPPKEYAHIRQWRYADLFEYHLGVSGEGEHAANWADKPHRLVYDLTGKLADTRDELAALRTKLEEAERRLADARREGMEDALLAVQHLRNPYYRGTEAIKHAWEIGVIEATKAIRAKIGEQK